MLFVKRLPLYYCVLPANKRSKQGAEGWPEAAVEGWPEGGVGGASGGGWRRQWRRRQQTGKTEKKAESVPDSLSEKIKNGLSCSDVHFRIGVERLLFLPLPASPRVLLFPARGKIFQLNKNVGYRIYVKMASTTEQTAKEFLQKLLAEMSPEDEQ